MVVRAAGMARIVREVNGKVRPFSDPLLSDRVKSSRNGRMRDQVDPINGIPYSAIKLYRIVHGNNHWLAGHLGPVLDAWYRRNGKTEDEVRAAEQIATSHNL